MAFCNSALIYILLNVCTCIGMHNKGTYMPVYKCICARIDIRVYAKYTRITCTHMRSLDISELHCTLPW